MNRVSDDAVRSVLTWARNYGEIKSFRMVADNGRKWEVTLPAPRVIGSGLFAGFLGVRPEDVVPPVVVFTNREALAFGYGCAAGGIHDRAEFAKQVWGW